MRNRRKLQMSIHKLISSYVRRLKRGTDCPSKPCIIPFSFYSNSQTLTAEAKSVRIKCSDTCSITQT